MDATKDQYEEHYTDQQPPNFSELLSVHSRILTDHLLLFPYISMTKKTL